MLLQFIITVENWNFIAFSLFPEYHSHHLNMVVSHLYYILLYICQCNSRSISVTHCVFLFDSCSSDFFCDQNEDTFGCFISPRIVPSLLQKTPCSFERVIAVTSKQDMTILMLKQYSLKLLSVSFCPALQYIFIMFIQM